MKTIATCIPDIYNLLTSKDIPKEVDLEEELKLLGEEVVAIMRDAMGPEQDRAGRLRLSNVGKPDRQIYNQFTGISGQDLDGATHMKFLYGHLTEALLVSLLRLSGHSVTDQQKEVEVEGVKGHIDCFIDGTLVDIKSASPYGFKKFKRNTLHTDDPFGYIGQLKAYAHSLGKDKFAWLAMDKVTGELALLTYDTNNKEAAYAKAIDWDIVERVSYLKAMVLGSEVPQVCYAPVAEGSSGNYRLQSGCVYCPYRKHCWPSVREFGYSGGHKYFTTVVKEPRVLEIPKEF
jgi:hypothetical protein